MNDMEIQKQKAGEAEKASEGSHAKTIVDEAREQAERLEKANAEHKGNLDREEQLLARRALGGRTDGGSVHEPPKELTPQEYANAFKERKIPSPFRY